jgi:hypothetical protein
LPLWYVSVEQQNDIGFHESRGSTNIIMGQFIIIDSQVTLKKLIYLRLNTLVIDPSFNVSAVKVCLCYSACYLWMDNIVRTENLTIYYVQWVLLALLCSLTPTGVSIC